MGLFKTFIIFLISFSLSLFPKSQDNLKQQTLYLMHINQIEKAFTTYQHLFQINQAHDFDLLQKIAMIILEKGAKSEDNIQKRLSMFGAAIASSSSSIGLLEEGLNANDPEIQMIALHFLAAFQDDRCDDLLNKAMASMFLSTRMEAAYQMAQRKHSHALGHIEALMQRLPPLFKPFFPYLYAKIATPEATSLLLQLLNDTNFQVRVEAIINTALFNRDELLTSIRKKLNHSTTAELEAAAFAVGNLQDSASIKRLKQLTKYSSENVKISANRSLYVLGEDQGKTAIENLAKKKHFFAIAALGDISSSEDVLYDLTKEKDLQIRANAAIALLKRKDPRCLSVIKEILLKDSRDLALQPVSSVGKALLYFRIVPSSMQLASKKKIDLALSLSIKEYLLKQALDLPEKDFLSLADEIFSHSQNDLIPQLVVLLENLGSSSAIALLKENAIKAKSALILDYAHLSLYRLKQGDIYEEYVQTWLLSKKNKTPIQLRPLLPRTMLIEKDAFELSPEETSRLLTDMYAAIASKQDEKSISILIEAIKMGHPDNRFALAGLLLKSVE